MPKTTKQKKNITKSKSSSESSSESSSDSSSDSELSNTPIESSDNSSCENDSDSSNDKNNKQQKKRGRPKKGIQQVKSVNILKSLSPIKNKEEHDDEIILHLPIYENDSEDSSSDKNAFTMKDDSDSKPKNTIISSLTANDSSDNSDSDSDSNSNESDSNINVRKLLNEVKKRDTIIKKLKSTINEMKNDNSTLICMRDVKTKLLNIKLIDINKNNEYIVVDKTDVACWWCTYNFDTMPCFIPDRYFDDKFYVFGCFCTYSCAMAYNMSMNDYRVPLRISLIKKLYSTIFPSNDDRYKNVLSPAPQRELLKKFGGFMNIEDFRNGAMLCKKEFKLKLPPVIPLLPQAEEVQRDVKGENKFSNFRQKRINYF